MKQQEFSTKSEGAMAKIGEAEVVVGRILIVGDDPESCAALRDAFAPGAAAEFVTSADEALKKLVESDYALVLFAGMGGKEFDGLGAHRQIKAIHPKQATMVVSHPAAFAPNAASGALAEIGKRMRPGPEPLLAAARILTEGPDVSHPEIKKAAVKEMSKRAQEMRAARNEAKEMAGICGGKAREIERGGDTELFDLLSGVAATLADAAREFGDAATYAESAKAAARTGDVPAFREADGAYKEHRANGEALKAQAGQIMAEASGVSEMPTGDSK